MDLGKNIVANGVEAGSDELSLTIDLKQDFGLSSSGATHIIASTGGNKPLGQSGAVLGLNVYSKAGLKLEGCGSSPFTAVAEPKESGLGCRYTVSADGILTVFLKLAGPGRPSSSGKSTLLCSTMEKGIGGTDAALNVNCYTTDLTKLDVSRLGGASSFAVDATDLARIVVDVPLEGPSGSLQHPIRPITVRGAATDLKLTGKVTWSNAGTAATASDLATELPGSDGTIFFCAASTQASPILRLYFDGTALGTLDRPQATHLTVARVVDSKAAAKALQGFGVTEFHLTVLRPVEAFCRTAVVRATRQYFTSLSEDDVNNVSVKAARVAIRPLVDALCTGAKVPTPDLETNQELKTLLRDTLAGLVTSRGTGVDKRPRPDGDESSQ